MMRAIGALLLVCAALGRRALGAVPEHRRAGNGGLVEVIKLNLQRDNDDYTDAATTKRGTAAESAITTTFPTYSKMDKLKGLRRAHDEAKDVFLDVKLSESEQDVIAYKSNWRITPLSAAPNLNRLSLQSHPTITKQMPFTSNPGKIEKFQKYFEKNKDLFKEFLSSKIAARTQFPASFGRGGLQSRTIRLRADVNGNTTQKTGSLDGDESGTTKAPLDPDRLDMLPAVGGRVHYWRLRDRLCHRHVLMPEGPKYDSKGRVYLPAHGQIVRRPYNVTRRPHLLLPKCCNCCKKSVLGCE